MTTIFNRLGPVVGAIVTVAAAAGASSASAPAKPEVEQNRPLHRVETGAVCDAAVQAAVDDPDRIEANVRRDEGRKPCEVLSFFDVEPGSRHLELLAAQGYYTELFSALLGETGTLYHHNNATVLRLTPASQLAPLRDRMASGSLGNVEWLEGELEKIPLEDAELDSISAILTLHDYYWMSAVPESAALPELFRILRPGGRMLVIDHAAIEGSGVSAAVDQNGRHRIDRDYLIGALEEVGFALEAEAQILRNPGDRRTLPFFDPTLWRDKTDRFVLVFRKPVE